MNQPFINYASVKAIAERYGVSVSTVWRWARAGRIPQPVQLSPGCTRWKVTDLEQWEQSKGVQHD